MRATTLSGARNGTNTVFVLATAPVTGGLVLVVANGRLLQQVAGTPSGYTFMRAGTTVTVGLAPTAGQALFAYVQTSLTQSYTRTPWTGLAAPTNTVLTIATAPPSGSSLLVLKNGVVLEEVTGAPTAGQYRVSGTSVTLGASLAPTDDVWIYVPAVATALLAATPLVGAQDGLNTQYALPYAAPLNYEPDLLVTLNGLAQSRVLSAPLAGEYTLRDPQTVRLGSAPSGTIALQVLLLGILPRTTNPYAFTCERLGQRIGIWAQRRADTTEIEEAVRHVYDEYMQMYQWTALQIDGVFATEAIARTGSVGVTGGSRIVAGVGTAFRPDDVGKQFRLSSSQAAYTITSVDAVRQVLELNPPYSGQEATIGNTYELFQNVYALGPEVEYIFSMGAQTPLRETSVFVLDRVDAARHATSDSPSAFAYRGRDDQGRLLIEVYPVPSAATVIRYAGIRRDACLDKSQVLRHLDALILNAATAAVFLIIVAKTGAADPWGTLAQQYQAKADRLLERLLDLDFTRSGVAREQGMREDSGFDTGVYLGDRDWWIN